MSLIKKVNLYTIRWQNKWHQIKYGLNSVSYWDARFKHNWEEKNGRLQTALFAVAFVLLNEDFNVNTILDFGCGCGDSLPVIKMKYPKTKLFFYDISQEAMQKAKKNYSSIAFPINMPTDEIYDLVYCSNVIEHVADITSFCQNLIMLSKKYIIIQAPYEQRHADNSPITMENRIDEHIHTITNNTLDELSHIVEWKKILCDVPYAWDYGKQIFFIGIKKSN
ncbi:MAG: class I SAM-dependent methyltransferase [Calothrix sp. C42_A2020_038]|nr:class I SAM-dependent methyltransferase [Calothrix sp. C42_A2020_038]